jgi:hypothetical protein
MERKNAASLKQIRAALSFAYKHWDLKNPFTKIEPPLHKEPQILLHVARDDVFACNERDCISEYFEAKGGSTAHGVAGGGAVASSFKSATLGRRQFFLKRKSRFSLKIGHSKRSMPTHHVLNNSRFD